jgi:hypothetical protein
MPRVQIHCWGCDATVPVATSKSAEDLDRAGWSLARGETYCPNCAPERVPAPAASADAGDDLVEASDHAAGTDDDLEPSSNSGAARVLARIPWPRSGRGDGDAPERRLPRLKPVLGVAVTALQLPFRRSPAPVTSRSKVSSQTIVLFCIAAALTVSTLGSEHMAIRLPGVLFAFAAGVSWLRDLRRSA